MGPEVPQGDSDVPNEISTTPVAQQHLFIGQKSEGQGMVSGLGPRGSVNAAE